MNFLRISSFAALLLASCSRPPVAFEVVFDGPQDHRPFLIAAREGQVDLLSLPGSDFGKVPDFSGMGLFSIDGSAGSRLPSSIVPYESGEYPAAICFAPDGTMWGTRFLSRSETDQYSYALFRLSREGEYSETLVPAPEGVTTSDIALAWEGGVWVFGSRTTYTDGERNTAFFAHRYVDNFEQVEARSFPFGDVDITCHGTSQAEVLGDGELIVGFETWKEVMGEDTPQQHLLRWKPGGEPQLAEARLPGMQYYCMDATAGDLILWGTQPRDYSGEPNRLVATNSDLEIQWEKTVSFYGYSGIKDIAGGTNSWFVVGDWYRSRSDKAGVWALEIDRAGKIVWKFDCEAPCATSERVLAAAQGNKGYLLAMKKAPIQYAALCVTAFDLQ